MDFATAVERVLAFEGGFVDHPSDPGGATAYGITERVARQHGYTGDMRQFPLAMARNIYRFDYWEPCKCDQLPPAVRFAVFDAAVNSGVQQSIKWLQRACGVADDGIVGPKTLEAANALHPERLKLKLLAQRLRLMASLSHWPAFGRGWARRICDLMET